MTLNVAMSAGHRVSAVSAAIWQLSWQHQYGLYGLYCINIQRMSAQHQQHLINGSTLQAIILQVSSMYQWRHGATRKLAYGILEGIGILVSVMSLSALAMYQWRRGVAGALAISGIGAAANICSESSSSASLTASNNQQYQLAAASLCRLWLIISAV